MPKLARVNPRVLATGIAAEITGMSQQSIIKLFDNRRIEGFKIPGSKERRIPLKNLVSFMSYYPSMQARFLHYLEELNEELEERKKPDGARSLCLSPDEFGYDALIGKNGLRLHTNIKFYTTGIAAEIVNTSQQTVIRRFDDLGGSGFHGFRIPTNSTRPNRRLTPDYLARILLNNGFKTNALSMGLMARSPYFLEYPGQWKREDRVAGSPNSDQESLWYRASEKNGSYEVSFRRPNTDHEQDEGLYINQDHLILTGARFRNGEIIPRMEHQAALNESLDRSLELLGKHLPSAQENAMKAKRVIEDKREQLHRICEGDF